MAKIIPICSQCRMSLITELDEQERPIYYCSTCDKVTPRKLSKSFVAKVKEKIVNFLYQVSYVISGIIGFVFCPPILMLEAIAIAVLLGVSSCHDTEISRAKVDTYIVFMSAGHCSQEEMDSSIVIIKHYAREQGLVFNLKSEDVKEGSFKVQTSIKCLESSGVYCLKYPSKYETGEYRFTYRLANETDK